MNERYFLTPRNSIGKDGLEALGESHKALGDKHKEGLEALGKGVGEGLRGLGDGFGKQVKTGLEVFGISLSLSVVLGLGLLYTRRWPRNVGYVFVKTVNRNVSH